MEKIVIEGVTREGNIEGRKMKKDGKIPAVVYGKETKTMPIEIKIKDIEKTVKTLSEGALLITLKLTDKKEEKIVTISEVQRNPKTDEIIHADFHQISEKEETTFHVPVFSTGSAEGVKMGGILEHSLREVLVKCLPGNLPEKFDVDVTPLNIGDDITVADLPVPEGVEMIESPGKVLFAVAAQKKEEEPKPEEELAAEEGKEPERIGEKKEEGEEGAEPEGEKKAEKKK